MRMGIPDRIGSFSPLAYAAGKPVRSFGSLRRMSWVEDRKNYTRERVNKDA